MADNDPKGVSERRQAANSDPFAELSRIIGYAPQGGPDAAGQSQSAGFADDLEMDMERELLGSFAQEVRPVPAPRFSPAAEDAPVVQPAAAADGQAVQPEMDLDDLGIALDLDAELAASLAETAGPVEDGTVEEVEADHAAAANDDTAPVVPADDEAAKLELDEAALATLLAAEFDGAANGLAASASAPAAMEDREAASAGAAAEPAMVAEGDRHVVFEEHAGDAASAAVEKPGLFDDFEAALLRSIDADAAAGPAAADADPLPPQAVADEAADEVILLPGDLAAWRAEAAAEPQVVIPEEPVAHERGEPSVASMPDGEPDLAGADFEDELAAAFGADIMAETRSAAQARVATQEASAPELAAIGIDEGPAVAGQPEDIVVVTASVPEASVLPAEDEAGGDAPDEPAFELDLAELATAAPEEAREQAVTESDHVVTEPALAVAVDEVTVDESGPLLPAGVEPTETPLAFDGPAPVALDEAAGGFVDAGPVEEFEPAADAFEQVFLSDEHVDVEEFEPSSAAEAAPASDVVDEPVGDLADLDRSLAASLAAEFADTDLFSDITLDIEEPVGAVAEPDDVPAEPAAGWQEARAGVATDAAEIDFEAAMAEVDADFSVLPAAPEVEAHYVESTASVAVAASSALKSDLDNLLDQMQAQTVAAAGTRPAVETVAPIDDPFDLLTSEDLFGQALREAAEDELAEDEFLPEAEAAAPVSQEAAAPVEAVSAEPAPVEPELPPVAVPERETSEWAYGEWNVTRVAAAFSDIPREPEAAASAETVVDDREVPHTNAPAAASPAAASAMTAAPAPEVPSPTRDDPFAALAAMAARYKRSEPMSTQTGISEFDAAPRQSDARATQPAYDDDFGFAAEAPRHEDVPDIQTVDVGDGAVALADDLDIPDLHFEDEPAPGNAAYDDLDAEFNSLISDMAGSDPRLARAGAAVDPRQEAQAHEAPRGYAAAAIAGAMASQAHDRPAQAAPQRVEPAHAPANDAYDPFDDDLPLPAYEAIDPEPQPRRRGYFLASVIGGLALLGGVAAFAFSFGDGTSAVPTLVKADAQPIKVRPENPGGTVVPHQDNKVYQTVAGKSDATLEQHKLLTTAEEPVDIAVPQMADDDAPFADEDVPMAPALAGVEPDAAAGKSEDRVLADRVDTGTTVEEEVALVQPRKVRTMVVKSDGTLVPREEPAAVAQPVNAGAEPEQGAAGTDDEATFTIPGAEAAVPAAKAVRTAATPVKAPVAPVRPADQPVDIVGGVRADQVASISTGGEWSMQIASQPSQAGAQAEYATLSKRYAKVLQGQPVNIVKAEISGKGTFWRVRVPADSKAAAAALCGKYKAAGGNCFVSR